MRSRIVVFVCGLALVACQKPKETVSSKVVVHSANVPSDASGKRADIIRRVGEAVIEKMLVGNQLGTDGTVVEDQKIFTEGEPVYVTFRLHDSPVGLTTGVIWYDQQDHSLASERKAMNGGKVATFTFNQKVKPGKYHVRGYWGGNIIDDREFEVLAKTKTPR